MIDSPKHTFIPEIGQKVRLSGCPFDLQIEEEQNNFERVFAKTQVVTEIQEVAGPNWWIKTDILPNDWIAAFWFRLTKDENI